MYGDMPTDEPSEAEFAAEDGGAGWVSESPGGMWAHQSLEAVGEDEVRSYLS